MLNRIAFVFSLLAMGTAPALAETVFIGAIRITAVTPQCRDIRVGDFGTSRFHPLISTQVDRFEGISWLSQFQGVYWAINNRRFDSAFRTARGGGLGAGATFEFASAEAPQVRLTYRPAITSTTPTAIITGQVRRPINDSGGLACIATFVAAYVKQK